MFACIIPPSGVPFQANATPGENSSSVQEAAPAATTGSPTHPAEEQATAAPPAKPEATKDSGVPFTITENLLPGEKVTDLNKGINEINLQFAEDGQGIVHVIWAIPATHLYHRDRDPNGQWSDIAPFPTNDSSEADGARILMAPNGQVCVLWLNKLWAAKGSAFQVECYASGQWSPAQDITAQLAPMGKLANYIHAYQAQFDPQGHLQIYAEVLGNDAVPAGYYLGGQRLFPGEDEDGLDVSRFRIDSQGNDHLLIVRKNHEVIYRMSKDQGKTWQELALTPETAFNGGYARLAPDQDRYFHFVVLTSNFSDTSIDSWVSSRLTPQAIPLFNRDEMQKKQSSDPRYQKLPILGPEQVAVDESGVPHFFARVVGGGFSHVVLKDDGAWVIQNILDTDKFLVETQINQKNDILVLWRTNDALFFSRLDDPSGTPGSTPVSRVEPTAIPPAATAVVTTRKSPKDGMDMVYVSGGNFQMGSAVGEGTDADRPQHTVDLDAFWIDQTEVTNSMYQICVQKGSCTPPTATRSDAKDNYFGNPQYNAYPVNYANWNQADAYCKWAGRRLPTEAEWEKAARGTDGRLYPWGANDPVQALGTEDNVHGVQAVGSYPAGASPYGAWDMAGNAAEWVADWYGPYPSGSVSNPKGPSTGKEKVQRGGSRHTMTDYIKTTARDASSPTESGFGDFGFRCALSP